MCEIKQIKYINITDDTKTTFTISPKGRIVLINEMTKNKRFMSIKPKIVESFVNNILTFISFNDTFINEDKENKGTLIISYKDNVTKLVLNKHLSNDVESIDDLFVNFISNAKYK